jgi:hypothetical protein
VAEAEASLPHPEGCSLPTCSTTEQPLVYSDEGRNSNDEEFKKMIALL